MGYLAWLVLFLVVSVLGEFLAEITKVLNTDEQAKPVAVVWFVFLGLAGGLFTTMVVPERLLPPGPFEGVSLLTLPAVLAVALAVVGWIRRASSTHLASWYGGASFGIGLAMGRLVGLAFAAEIQTV